MLTRREWLGRSVVGAAALLVSKRLVAEAAAPIAITVYKSPTCGCCAKWVKHLEANGFKPTVHDVSDVDEIKRTMGVPAALASCHTAVLGRYVVEGHVPADLLQKMLKEKPAILGLAVPGMVNGTPGMEAARADRYDVIAFDRSGKTHVYASR